MTHESYFCVCSLVTGLMQGSKHPWPQTKEKGGGVVMPCEYLVEIEKRHEEEIWSLLVNLIDQSKCPGLITIVVSLEFFHLSLELAQYSHWVLQCSNCTPEIQNLSIHNPMAVFYCVCPLEKILVVWIQNQDFLSTFHCSNTEPQKMFLL